MCQSIEDQHKSLGHHKLRWLRSLGYELDIDQALAIITTLLAEEIDKATKHFGTHDVVKSRVVIDLKIANIVKREEKIVKNPKKKFGAKIGEIGTTKEA